MAKLNRSNPECRNRNYADTHRCLIEKAVELISESGTEGVSVSALARAAGMGRSTVYYHFASRDAVITAIRKWSSEKLASGVNLNASDPTGVNHISSFVLGNPELIKMWVDDYIAAGDIRERFPQWDSLVALVNETCVEVAPGEECDAEVYCTLMLTGALIAPSVFKKSVHPEESLELISERFAREQQRLMQRAGLFPPQKELD